MISYQLHASSSEVVEGKNRLQMKRVGAEMVKSLMESMSYSALACSDVKKIK